METVATPWIWAGFFAFVLVATALLFAAWLWQHLSGTAGPEVAREKTLEYLTGYLIEKSPPVDNIFVS